MGAMVPRGETRGGFSRRDFLTGALATGTLAAVGTYFAPGGSNPTDAVIQFVTGADPTGARDVLVNMWNEANPRAKVAVNEVGGLSTLDQRNAMESRAASGEADLLNLDIINIPYFHDHGYIVPSDLEDVPEFLPNTLLASQLGDPKATTFWATPWTANAGMIFQRLPQAEIAQGGPTPPLPTIIDQLSAPGSFQFVGELDALTSDAREAFVVNFLEHALSRDPGLLDRFTGMPALAPERWQSALTPLRTAINQGRVLRADTEKAARDNFRAHGLPYMRNWPVEYRNLQMDMDPDSRTDHIGVGPLLTGVLGGGSLAVTRNAAQPQHAADFARFLAGVPAQTVLASFAIAPVRGGVYESSTLQSQIPHLRNVRTSIENARPRPVTPYYPEFSDAIHGYFANFMAGGEFTDSFSQDLRQVLKLT